ncbi:isoaspartyl peptidase/L-asparaginase family protein [Roseomonas xinghualingensis]|uniref:isoaspartyl peptidase/L-asparaginase family protein n=1 Tax=Roseomonas xinghualingensis TaxID=2986475 RepID=UPI0021F0E765|nr:isoaspartyl peptidase/L-asparaginase family protein [Roseomonas sp. SXEYE001]MCV4206327.1 isoaspartyl peptidase/L-asparaginase family protein [Roseomonas sp. SXEYE001]
MEAAIWALVLHGGAKEIAPEKEQANRAGCLDALAAGAALLRSGGSALDAVEAAIRVLEDDPTFNAGRGSVRNTDGEVEMDAAIMDGATLDVGGVAAIREVRHPISVARLMLRETPTLLVAEGARRFAAAHGAETWDPAHLAESAGESGHDTVGCIALDMRGNLAAGTSTGGLEGSLPGRVGDSPLPGCGLYAENALGAVAFSGDGESITRGMLAARVMQSLEAQPPQAAIEAALARLGRTGGEAGGIVLDRAGRIGWAHNSTHFAVAMVTSEDEMLRAYLRKDEEAAHA